VNAYFEKEISYVGALSWIVGSSVLFSFLAHKSIDYVFTKKNTSAKENTIAYIVQTGPQKEALLSDYFAEFLGFSVDKPVPFASFDPKEATEKLKNSPVIAEAVIKKIKPNMAYIDYSVRKPIAWAIDFFNAALDGEGVIFPMHPFFSPKKMTEIYFGEKGLDWEGTAAFGSKLKGYRTDLAFSLLEILQDKGKDLFFVKRIDVSEALAPNLGKREVIVVLENEIYPENKESPKISSHFLRLTPKRFSEEIENYLKLRERLLEAESQEPVFSGFYKDKIIDLRLAQLAFIDSGVP